MSFGKAVVFVLCTMGNSSVNVDGLRLKDCNGKIAMENKFESLDSNNASETPVFVAENFQTEIQSPEVEDLDQYSDGSPKTPEMADQDGSPKTPEMAAEYQDGSPRTPEMDHLIQMVDSTKFFETPNAYPCVGVKAGETPAEAKGWFEAYTFSVRNGQPEKTEPVDYADAKNYVCGETMAFHRQNFLNFCARQSDGKSSFPDVCKVSWFTSLDENMQAVEEYTKDFLEEQEAIEEAVFVETALGNAKHVGKEMPLRRYAKPAWNFVKKIRVGAAAALLHYAS